MFPHFLILSSFQYFIIVSIPQNRSVWNNNDASYSDFKYFIIAYILFIAASALYDVDNTFRVTRHIVINRKDLLKMY